MKHDFRYISKHDAKVQNAHKDLLDLIHEVQRLVQSNFTFKYYTVGSYHRNMITYDAKSNTGYDFDVNIEVNDDENEYSPKKIRNILREALNKVTKKHGYDYSEDSTSVLTIKVKDRKHSRIVYSCDFAIVNNHKNNDGYDCQKYIRFNKHTNLYDWCEQPKGYYMLQEKIKWLKENGLWNDVRDRYIDKKNKEDNPHNHSRSIFAQTINDICALNGFNNEE